MNLAMKYYMEKKRAHDEFIQKERAEFELGKRHLANMMGDKGAQDVTSTTAPIFFIPYRPYQCLATDSKNTVYRVAICPRGNLHYIRNYPINNTVLNLIYPVVSLDISTI